MGTEEEFEELDGEFEPCERFSPEEYHKYTEIFQPFVLEALKARPSLDHSELFKILVMQFPQGHPKLWRPRNLPMTKYFLDRALYILEDRADSERKNKRISFDGQKYSLVQVASAT